MDQQTIVSFAAAALALLALILALSAHKRLTAARKSLLLLQGSFDGKTLIEAVSSYLGHVESVESDLQALASRQEELFGVLGRSARNLGVVRYDAFEDMGGKLSFSAAILDDHGTGVVLTAINARNEARLYAKPVSNGGSEHNLSKDEHAAIAEALGRSKAGAGKR